MTWGDAYEALLRVNPGSGAVERVPLTGSPTGVASLAGGVVYVVREDGTVTAVSVADGRQLWRQATEMESLSGPVVSTTYDSVYFVSRFGRLPALDRDTGAERWHTAGLDSAGGVTEGASLLLVKDAIVATALGTALSVSPDRPTARQPTAAASATAN
ncbi:PQQ-binding-like beta-propeller repeat protein [Streptomyces fulvoviolaceus]|uniref:outer membrane protein assembly factor BamB family protein n=1 Tax=Streptomyces fulvoviolaceus TaxID=285535 RepID=UPI0004C50076|nr:PQQ-binding-like beta-propeller repeat protein [Streptomyces fulvoviolaceus]